MKRRLHAMPLFRKNSFSHSRRDIRNIFILLFFSFSILYAPSLAKPTPGKATLSLKQAKVLVQQAEALIRQKEIIQAKKILEEAIQIHPIRARNPAFDLSEQISKFISEDFLLESLILISDLEFYHLRKGNLKKTFFNNSELNRQFLEAMRSVAFRRPPSTNSSREDTDAEKKERVKATLTEEEAKAIQEELGHLYLGLRIGRDSLIIESENEAINNHIPLIDRKPLSPETKIFFFEKFLLNRSFSPSMIQLESALDIQDQRAESLFYGSGIGNLWFATAVFPERRPFYLITDQDRTDMVFFQPTQKKTDAKNKQTSQNENFQNDEWNYFPDWRVGENSFCLEGECLTVVNNTFYRNFNDWYNTEIVYQGRKTLLMEIEDEASEDYFYSVHQLIPVVIGVFRNAESGRLYLLTFNYGYESVWYKILYMKLATDNQGYDFFQMRNWGYGP